MNYHLAWTSHPDEWQPLLDIWAHRFPGVRIDDWPQYGSTTLLSGLAGEPVRAGQVLGATRVRAITLGAEGPEKPFRLLVTVPHAHAPAGTAACVDLLSELLGGQHRDGSPSDLDRERILAHTLITLIPDANPQGRTRSPERVWDGTRYDSDEFLKVVFGVAADGSRFGRYPEWRLSEHHPQRIGISYEQLGPDLYGEPDTNRKSTHTRAVDDLFTRYHYTHFLEIHQHNEDEAARLPADYEEGSVVARQTLAGWADKLIAAWRDAGASPYPQPYVPCRSSSRQQCLRDYWQDRCPGMLRLTSEVRNNRHVRTGEPTPLEYQLRMAQAALRATLAMGLK